MAKLAILGGAPLVNEELAAQGKRPVVPAAAMGDIQDMLQNGEISISPVVPQLEKEFAAYVDAKYALCTCNGTTALQAALFAVGVQPGDEVIVPSYTFWATAAPIMAAHGKPVFCDVEEDTYNIDPACIERLVTPRTRAIMLVHVWGSPCNMTAICEVARRHGIAVIEDCAHAHGATYQGKKVGLLGDVGMFSFQGSKVIAAGEGGILVTNSRSYYERAVALGHYERLAGLPGDSEYRKYSLTGLGFKHRIAPLGAAIALAGLRELDERNDIRDANGKALDARVGQLPFITLQRVLPDCRRLYAYHYARYWPEQLGGVALITVLQALKAEGLSIGVCGYGRLHEAPLFTGGSPYAPGCPCSRVGEQAGSGTAPAHLPVTKALAESTFFMAPRFENPAPQLVAAYADAYEKLYDNLDELRAYEAENPADYALQKRVSSTSINLL